MENATKTDAPAAFMDRHSWHFHIAFFHAYRIVPRHRFSRDSLRPADTSDVWKKKKEKMLHVTLVKFHEGKVRRLDFWIVTYYTQGRRSYMSYTL